MRFFQSDRQLDKRIGEAHPGAWEVLELSSEHSRAKGNSYKCAKSIADAAKSADFPVIVGVAPDSPVSTDGSMWSCLIRVAWPSGHNMSRFIERVHIDRFGLGRIAAYQHTADDYAQALIRYGCMKTVWRCNRASPASAGTERVTATSVDPELIKKYSEQVETILSSTCTQKHSNNAYAPSWESLAEKVVDGLEEQWRKGDPNALSVLLRIIRREFEAPSGHQEKLQTLALQVMVSNPQASVEPLLSIVRDQDGNLAFPTDRLTYGAWPDKVLHVLGDIALGGVATKRLVYEFIRIGTKVDEIPGCGTGRGTACKSALFNIRRLVYGDDQTALFAGLPAFTAEEKKYLVEYGYQID